jgi:hypothetical protein
VLGSILNGDEPLADTATAIQIGRRYVEMLTTLGLSSSSQLLHPIMKCLDDDDNSETSHVLDWYKHRVAGVNQQTFLSQHANQGQSDACRDRR